MSSAPIVSSSPPASRRPRSLALALVDAFSDRIRAGEIAAGAKLPTEAELMDEFGVSRTVVREALSRLQAAGLVRTRHGIGSFAADTNEAPPFRIAPDSYGTLREVIAVLELRLGLETEAAALAAQRRTEADLRAIRDAVNDFDRVVRSGSKAVAADIRFHLGVARATQNRHFAEFLTALGTAIIPRAQLAPMALAGDDGRTYLQRINAEHETILGAIQARDSDVARAAMRTHLANSRERRRRAMEAGAQPPVPAPARTGKVVR
jgi:DNA-binding FadR family transcriptional regulator